MSGTKLFLDWSNVVAAQVRSTLDPGRISEEGRALIERNRKMYGMHQDLSGHGLKREHMPFGVAVSAEKPRKSDPWLVADKQWEKSLGWLTVIHEEGRYRCWYSVTFPGPLGGENAGQTFHEGRRMDVGNNGLCYAESTDGLHWVKPELGLFSFEGSKANNIVSIWQMSETAVFRDPSAPPAERYKAFIWDKLSDDPNRPDRGLFGAVSPDGLRWSRLPEPLIPEFCDTQNVACWDERKQKYIGYFRGAVDNGRARAIRYAETNDFRRWPSPEIIACPGPLDQPSDDFYNNSFTRHPDDPSARFIFCSVFHHSSDVMDVRLGLVHGDRVINWVSREPVIEVGRTGAWDCGSIYACPNMVRLPGGALALPYHGLGKTHQESHHAFYRDCPEVPNAFAWAAWDRGRIAGIEARDHGQFWTCLFRPGEGRIEIDARTTRAGVIETGLWEHADGSFRPVPGRSIDDCVPFSGDKTWTPLRWKGGEGVTVPGDRLVRLQVRLTSGKIFGFRTGAGEETMKANP